MRMTLRFLGLWIYTLLLASPALAWPDRPIRLVVPYGAGGTGDIVARLLAEEMRPMLGQPLIVENRAGASGNLGASAVERANPDGYTLLIVSTNNLVVNQFLYKSMGYDPLTAFQPISFLINVPSVLFVQPSIGRTFIDFNKQAKARKGQLNYGSPGNGTTPHLSINAINHLTGWDMTHVPYQGASQAITALIAGDIHAYMGGAVLGLQHIKGGKLTAVAVASAERLAVLPATPTFEEVGLGSIKASNWWGLVAPKGTPTAVIERINSAVREALMRPQMTARLEQLGVEAYPSSPRVMGQTLVQEAAFWKKAVADARVSLE